jgi:hypothetical protein
LLISLLLLLYRIDICNYGPGGNYNGEKPYTAGSGTNAACAGQSGCQLSGCCLPFQPIQFYQRDLSGD